MNPLAILALISELYEGTKNLRDELDAAREEINQLRTRLDELIGPAS